MGAALAEETIATGGLSLRRCHTCGEEFPSDYRVCPLDSTPLGMDRDAEDPLLGAVLGGTYRIVRTLGKGGMGHLYEAQHARLERQFAIKVLHEAQSRSADARKRFEREAQALSQIRSDHVLDVVDVLRTPDGRTAIVTARLEGEDFKARLDRVRKLTAAEVVPIVRQVCRGLAAAHACGVIHRDMKPSNLFLESGADGRVVAKILDFGVAKLASAPDLTRTGAVVGTPAYMAPEQARGSAKVDERADIYAVGAVLYRALTGRPPYLGSEPAELLSSLLHERPKRPRSIEPSIPVGLEAVIQRAMSRDPSARPADALELERELAAFDFESDAPSSAIWEPNADTPKGSSSTLILPRGSVERAKAMSKRARRARPFAALLTVAAALVSGAASAWLASGVWGLQADATITPRMSWLLAVTGAIAATALCVRGLSARWESAPEIQRADRAMAWGGLAALAVFGAGALTVDAWTLLEGGAAWAATWGRIGPVLAGLAAGLGAGWRAWRI